MPFDKILDAVQSESVEAGLLIHEGQLLFPQLGLHRVMDLGVWWHEQTNLPLAAGGNAVRRALGPELGPPDFSHHPRQRGIRPRTSRRSSELRDAIRARYGNRNRRQVRRHVRQSLDARLRRPRQAGGHRVDQSRHRCRAFAWPSLRRVPRRVAAQFCFTWLPPMLSVRKGALHAEFACGDFGNERRSSR